MRVFLLFVVFCAVSAQQEDDATSLNPRECGLTYKQASRLMKKTKRHASALEAVDQREYAWHVVMMNRDGETTSSGSLINSHWVLSQAYNSE